MSYLTLGLIVGGIGLIMVGLAVLWTCLQRNDCCWFKSGNSNHKGGHGRRGHGGEEEYEPLFESIK